jgi:hypothetical protein
VKSHPITTPDIRATCGERGKRAHYVNSFFALRALAAQNLLQARCFLCRNAAKKPANRKGRSEDKLDKDLAI